MSTPQKGLTELQEQIIDALANDYESLEQISEILDSSVKLSPGQNRPLDLDTRGACGLTRGH